MAELAVTNVPTTVVTGFLGVGKTTAILSMFQHRPDNERWAVLVNEFGDVGIDGTVLSGAGGLEVREIPGGCICCSAGLEMKMGLVRLLRDVRPDRLFVEPTGLAHPASIVDMLRSPGIREAVALRATLCLVDPKQFLDSRYTSRENWRDQLRISDVLVANRTDLATDAQMTAFREAAAALYPPKLAVIETVNGQIEERWLHEDPAPAKIRLDVPHGVDDRSAAGWILPPSIWFDRVQLEDAIGEIMRPGGPLAKGAIRLKGVFRTPRVWLLVQATHDQIKYEAIHHRRDNRVEVIADEAVDEAGWEAVKTRLLAAQGTVESLRR